jgi:predicted Fe-Mo cluster-binding NifX family protein
MIKIALASEDNKGLDGEMSHHFGRCPYYTMATVEEGQVKGVELVSNPHFERHQPGVMPRFIHEQGADVIIAGGMGPMAVDLFTQLGIEAVTGGIGNVGRVLQAYLNGEIKGAAPCDHDHGRGGGH